MKKLLAYLAFSFLVSFSAYAQSGIVTDFKPVGDSLAVLLTERTGVQGQATIKSIMKRGSSLDFYFTESLGDYPWKDGDPRWFKSTLGKLIPDKYRKYKVGEIYSRGVALNNLVTPRLSSEGKPSASRYKLRQHHQAPAVVTSLDSHEYKKGMDGRHIALWQSHGRYYAHSLDRWTWQRPCLFQTCEDMFTQSFVLPFLVPMLENAGAYVMLPRERDTQVNEVIVDNDSSWVSEPVYDVAGWSGAVRGIGNYKEYGSWKNAGAGFADPKETYTGIENPFTMGTVRSAETIPHGRKSGQASIEWRPEIPSRGSYAVYISYKSLPNSSTSAHYTVRHMGGESHFAVNQKMGGGTWIYLGTFEFEKGKDGYVTLSNETPEGYKFVNGSIVSADAVRFGGGMGNIERTSKDSDFPAMTSGIPRSAEGARYWLQWAGASDEIFSQNEENNDYKDDFMSRGDWVEWLTRGSSVNPKKKGMGIPVDLAFGFHSDAGATPNDSIVGTLAIYTLRSDGSQTLPTGDSRMTSRGYADLVQSQIVNDIRAEYDSLWSRRHIWDRGYRESRTPTAPAMLLELLSHQNFADMKYGLDPAFRFTVSRAVYKGMLKYLSNRYGVPYVVQPLPVESIGVNFGKDGKAVLSWEATEDANEPTAKAKGYILYTRTDNGGFDNGTVITDLKKRGDRLYSEVTIKPGHIYSFRIAAYNEGGRSFPSETVSIGLPANGNTSNKVLIVNNFDRISGPAFIDTPTYAGFNNRIDSGVPHIRDIAYIGDMHEFRRDFEYVSNDNPGFGASYSDYAGNTVAGNTFDFAYVHGKAIMGAGYPFYSCSNETFCNDTTFRSDAWSLDMICGKQVTTSIGSGQTQRFSIFPEEMQTALKTFTSAGGNVLISGAYIGTDVWDGIYPVQTDSLFREQTKKFAKDVLGYRWAATSASRKGAVRYARNEIIQPISGEFTICNEINSEKYSVESPDGISPSSSKGKTIMRYTDSGISAGICHEGRNYRTICLGFPIEALESEKDINQIIRTTLQFFNR